MKGKKTCKILKDIRRQIALDNDIDLVISECTYQGDCLGTCPKCEAEVRYLERELEKRQRLGKVAMISGMAMTTLFGLSSCDGNTPQPTEGLEPNPDTIEVEKLEGDVPYFPDSTDTEDAAELLEGIVEAPGSEENSVVRSDTDEDLQGEAIDEDLDVFMVVEEMPEFPGGMDGLISYLQENIHYPQNDICVVGRVFVNFIIEKDGSVTNVKTLRGLHPLFDEEAVRVVSNMPKWKPGKQRGKPVRVSYNLPVKFELNENENNK